MTTYTGVHNGTLIVGDYKDIENKPIVGVIYCPNKLMEL